MASTFASDPLSTHPDLAPEDRAWLQMLVGDWQLVADLALADLVLWHPAPASHAGGGHIAMAQVRPFTAPTLFHRDIVGSRARADLRALLDRVWRAGPPADGAGPLVEPGASFQVRLWPVVRAGRVVGVVSAHEDPHSRPARSAIEENYLASAGTILDMVQHGRWPDPHDPPAYWIGGTPRVGDGLVILGPDSAARFTSPNAVSALRRLGVNATVPGHSPRSCSPAPTPCAVPSRRAPGRCSAVSAPDGPRSRPTGPRSPSAVCPSGAPRGGAARSCSSGTSPSCVDRSSG